MKNKSILFTGIIVVIVTAIISVGIFKMLEDKPLRSLPVLGPHKIDTVQQNGSIKLDTVFHHIGNFSFIDQTGAPVTPDNFKDKIYVADYFFCTCQSICPVMTKQMARVANEWQHDSRIAFISHTVNPEYDSVNVLASYAIANGVRHPQWYLVTGDKKELYDLARNSYLLDASEGDGGENDFIHTEYFALIDTQKRIRGYYDGTDSVEVNKLIKDIALLLKETEYRIGK
jgi:protein SCO1